MIGLRSRNWWRSTVETAGRRSAPPCARRRAPRALDLVVIDIEVLGLEHLEIERASTGPCSGRSTARAARPGARQRAAAARTPEMRRIMSIPRPGQEPIRQRRRILPEPLQLVERSRLRVKQVDHEIHEIEQHPAAAGQSLDVVGPCVPGDAASPSPSRRCRARARRTCRTR